MVDGDGVAREREAHARHALEPLHVRRELAHRAGEPRVVDAEERVIEVRFRAFEAPALAAHDRTARRERLHELQRAAGDHGARFQVRARIFDERLARLDEVVGEIVERAHGAMPGEPTEHVGMRHGVDAREEARARAVLHEQAVGVRLERVVQARQRSEREPGERQTA